MSMDQDQGLAQTFELSITNKCNPLEWSEGFYWQNMGMATNAYHYHVANLHDGATPPLDHTVLPDSRYSSQDASTPEKEATETTERRAKRQDQNRKAQKAFRARKEDQLRALERKLGEGKLKIESLESEVVDLKASLNESRVQVETLKSTLSNVVSNAIAERSRSLETSYDQDSKLLTLNLDLRSILQTQNSSLLGSPVPESIYSADSAVQMSSMLDKPASIETFR